MGMFEFEMFLQSRFTPSDDRKEQIKTQKVEEPEIGVKTGEFKASDVDQELLNMKSTYLNRQDAQERAGIVPKATQGKPKVTGKSSVFGQSTGALAIHVQKELEDNAETKK